MDGSTMIICPNCGAEIDKDVPKCPYCGYINMAGARKKYQADLNEIRDNIDEVKKEPNKALVKGFSGGVRVILATVVTLLTFAVIFGIMLAIDLKDKPKEFLSPQEEAYASAYRKTAEEELDAAYENKDIAAMAKIYDKAYSEDRVNLYGVDHYDSAYASSLYMKLKESLSLLDEGKTDNRDTEAITYYSFYFYYRAYGDDGAEIFDPIREKEIIPLITDRLGYTIEDMEGFKDKVVDGPYVNRSAIRKVTKKNYKNYK